MLFGEYLPFEPLLNRVGLARSIEEGLPTVRATTSGISALIGPGALVRAEIPDGRHGYIDALLPQPHPPNWFARKGNLIPLTIASIVTIAFAAFHLLSRLEYPRRRRAKTMAAGSLAPHQNQPRRRSRTRRAGSNDVRNAHS